MLSELSFGLPAKTFTSLKLEMGLVIDSLSIMSPSTLINSSYSVEDESVPAFFKCEMVM